MNSTIWTIARREISVKLRDRAFLVGFAMLVTLLCASIFIPIALSSGTPSFTVATSGAGAKDTASLAAQLGAAQTGSVANVVDGPEASGATITVVDGPSDEAAIADLLAGGDVTAVLVGDDPAHLTAYGTDGVTDGLLKYLTQASQTLQVQAVAAEAGLTSSQVSAITSPAPVQVNALNGSSEKFLIAKVTSFIFAFLFFFAALTFGIAIAQSVVEEKQSRVVEILVAAVPVRTLLAGKVIGNTLLAVGQLVIFVALGLVGAQLMGYGAFLGPLLASSAWFVLFFIAGFVMLACLWAVAGSLASRFEDLGSTTGVMQFVVMAPFFAAMFVTDPTWVKVLSYFPLTAPLVMPTRVLSEQAAWWEPIVALGLVMATAYLFIVLGARLYKASIMHTSGRLKLSDALKNLKTAEV